MGQPIPISYKYSRILFRLTAPTDWEIALVKTKFLGLIRKVE